MKEFIVRGKTYRIKKMNAIEVLALKQHVDFEHFNGTYEFFKLVLERVEYKMNESQWLPVREVKDKLVNYYPSGIEEDIDSLNEIIQTFMDWLKSVFQKSSESKE